MKVEKRQFKRYDCDVRQVCIVYYEGFRGMVFNGYAETMSPVDFVDAGAFSILIRRVV